MSVGPDPLGNRNLNMGMQGTFANFTHNDFVVCIAERQSHIL